MTGKATGGAFMSCASCRNMPAFIAIKSAARSRRRAKLSAKRPPRRRTESSAPSARTLPLRTGAPYIPFGTTVYALISQDDALVEQTLQSLAAAPFNKLRLCVFPKDYDYNHNEPPLYAFACREDGSWDTSRPSIAFYQRLERILRRIAALGIQLDLILFHPYDRWGFAAMPQADNFRYLDYLLRRLSAMPEIWWSLANEYDLCMPKKTLADWEALEAFGRLLRSVSSPAVLP